MSYGLRGSTESNDASYLSIPEGRRVIGIQRT
jgi:hypothetical protein